MSKLGTSGGPTALPNFAMIAGAMTASVAGASFTYGQGVDVRQPSVQRGVMSPQDQDFIFAKVDAKMESLRGDVRLNTQGLAELKERFTDLAARMATVPSDLATLKEKVSSLPTKDELGTKLRNYLASAGVIFAVIGTIIGMAFKFLGK